MCVYTSEFVAVFQGKVNPGRALPWLKFLLATGRFYLFMYTSPSLLEAPCRVPQKRHASCSLPTDHLSLHHGQKYPSKWQPTTQHMFYQSKNYTWMKHSVLGANLESLTNPKSGGPTILVSDSLQKHQPFGTLSHQAECSGRERSLIGLGIQLW